MFLDLGDLILQLGKRRQIEIVTYPSHGEWQRWEQLADFHPGGWDGGWAVYTLNKCPR